MPQVPQTELMATRSVEEGTVESHDEALNLPSVPASAPTSDQREPEHDGEREDPSDNRERSSPMLAE